MTPAEAILIANDAYPKGPETIAGNLGVEIRYRPLSVDGWCIRGPLKTIISLDQNAPETRQRFTLAHEVSHVIYGTKTEILGRGFEFYDGKSLAERQANALASQLLLPLQRLQPHIQAPIVDPAIIRRISQEATVSERVVALRLAVLASELAIGTVGVAAMGGGKIEWRNLSKMPLTDADLNRFYKGAQSETGRLYREHGRAGRVYVAAALHNVAYPTLFIQELPYDQAVTVSKVEKIRDAGSDLFAGDERFRTSLEGKFGAFKPTAKGMSLEDAVEAFVQRYADKWTSDEHKAKFQSAKCRRFIKLKLAQWFSE